MMGKWWENLGYQGVCRVYQDNHKPSPNHRHWHWLRHRAEIHFVQGDPLKKNSETDAATLQAHWSTSEIPPF
jgi:hypothetical protein